MANYNIYKLKEGKYDALVEKLSKVGYTVVHTTDIGNYQISSLFTTVPKPTDIWWLEQFGQFFPGYTSEKNTVYSGALLVQHKQNNIGYIVALGKTHFYVQEFVSYSFGLDMAERIGSESGTKSKSSKHFAGQTSKSITSFVGDSILTFKPGEATDYVKLKPLDKETWGGSYIHFGTSIQFSSIEIEPSNIDKLLDQIEVASNQESVFKLPCILPIKDEEQVKALDGALAQAIVKGDGNLGIVDFELYGSEFVFAQQTHAKIEWNGQLSEILYELSLDAIKNFASSHQLALADVLRELKVKFFVNETSKFTVPLVNMIDFIGDENTFLYRGKWYIFSQSYMETLQASIQDVQVIPQNVGFSKAELTKWQEANKNKKVKYREKYVIDKLIQLKPSLVEYDRVVDFKNLNGKKTNIEVSDLYDGETKEIIVVKIGDAKDFGYAFDQAIRTLSLISAKKYISEKGKKIHVAKVRVFLVTTNKVMPTKVTDINSLSFQIKLSELVNLAAEKSVELSLTFDKYENS